MTGYNGFLYNAIVSRFHPNILFAPKATKQIVFIQISFVVSFMYLNCHVGSYYPLAGCRS